VYKVQLLQEESVRNLYQKQLTQTLESICEREDTEEEWKVLKDSICNAAYEASKKE
jgi:hypothetical protein